MNLKRAFVVHGEPGWDEASPVGVFDLFDVTPGSVKHERRDPQDYGIPRCLPEDLAGGDADENAAALAAVMNDEDQGGPCGTPWFLVRACCWKLLGALLI